MAHLEKLICISRWGAFENSNFDYSRLFEVFDLSPAIIDSNLKCHEPTEMKIRFSWKLIHLQKRREKKPGYLFKISMFPLVFLHINVRGLIQLQIHFHNVFLF